MEADPWEAAPAQGREMLEEVPSREHRFTVGLLYTYALFSFRTNSEIGTDKSSQGFECWNERVGNSPKTKQNKHCKSTLFCP